MKYTRIIADAWQLTTDNKKLVWFAFVPSFIGVLVFMIEVAWQYFVISEEFGGVQKGFVFEKIGDIFHIAQEYNLLSIGIFLTIFVLIFYFVLPAWIQSSLILGVQHRYKFPEKRLSLRQKIVEGFDHFFELFELRAILSPFDLGSIAFFGLTMFRYYHGDVFNFFLPILIGYGIFSLFAAMFVLFSPYFIVEEGVPFIRSIRRSIGLVFLHFGRTMGLAMLMILINVRVVVNVLVVFGVPALIFGIATYFTDNWWQGFFVILGSLVGVGLIGLAAYLSAILEVFSVAFWQRAFTQLRAEQKELEAETNS